MIADENRKLDQEMIAALTKIGFEINPGGRSAYAECSILILDGDFHLQMVTDNGARAIFWPVTRDAILSAAKALAPDPEDTKRDWSKEPHSEIYRSLAQLLDD